MIDDLKLQHEVRDYHSGETYGSVTAHHAGKQIGCLDYSQYGNHLYLHMINVSKEYQHHGVASQMMKHLKTEWPHNKIKWGMTTPEGEAFKRAYYKKQIKEWPEETSMNLRRTLRSFREFILGEEAPPSLKPAVRYNGKLLTGRTHGIALLQIPDTKERDRISADDSNMVFIDDHGKVRDRKSAARYALDFDLVNPKYRQYVSQNNDQLPSEFLKGFGRPLN